MLIKIRNTLIDPEEVQTVPEEVQTIPEEGVITDQGLILDPALLEGGDYSQPDMDEAPQY